MAGSEASPGSWLRRILHRLEHPEQLLGWRPAAERAFAEAELRILLVRPTPLFQLAGSITHWLVPSLLEQEPGTFVDLAFLPTPSQLVELERVGLPPVFGLCTGQAPRTFDVVAISHSVIFELVNIPFILERCGLLRPASVRLVDPTMPLLLLGGANAPFCLALLEPEALVDVVYLGDLEPRAIDLLQVLKMARTSRGSARIELLARLAQVPGCYVPTHPGPVQPQRCRMAGPQLPHEGMPLLFGEPEGSITVELSRGCPAWCAFCAEGWWNRPYREKQPAEVLAEALAWKRVRGSSREVTLSSYSFNVYGALDVLLPALARQFAQLSLMSQRIDTLAFRPDLLELEIACGKRSYSLGVEGVSERLRRVLAKGIEGAELVTAFRLLCQQPATREIKLFFLLTGTEERQDLAEFDALLGQLARVRAAGRSQPRVVLSCGRLTVYPATPLDGTPPILDRTRFAWAEQELERSAASVGFELRMPATWEEHLLANLLLLQPADMQPLLLRLSCQGKLYSPGLHPAWQGPLTQVAGQLRESRADWIRLGLPLADAAVRTLLERLRAVSRAADPTPDHCLHPEARRRRCLGCDAACDVTQRLRQVIPDLRPAAAAVRSALRPTQEVIPIWAEGELGWGAGRIGQAALHQLATRLLLQRDPALTERLLQASTPARDPGMEAEARVSGCCGWIPILYQFRADIPGADAAVHLHQRLTAILPLGEPGDPLRLLRVLDGKPKPGPLRIRFQDEWPGQTPVPDERSLLDVAARILGEHSIRHVLRKNRQDGQLLCFFEIQQPAARRRFGTMLQLRFQEQRWDLAVEAGPLFPTEAMRCALEQVLDRPVAAWVSQALSERIPAG